MSIVNLYRAIIPSALTVSILINNQLLVIVELLFDDYTLVIFLVLCFLFIVFNTFTTLFYSVLGKVNMDFISFLVVYFLKLFIKEILHHQLIYLMCDYNIKNISIKLIIFLLIYI